MQTETHTEYSPGTPSVITMDAIPSLSTSYAKALWVRRAAEFKAQELPKLAAHAHDIVLSGPKVTTYREICGFTESTTIPITYPQSLALAIHAQLVLEPSFPLRPLGLIHTRNSIKAHAPLAAGERYEFRCNVGETRKRDAGVEFDMLTHVYNSDEHLVWESITTVLSRQSRRKRHKSSPAEANEHFESPLQSQWDLPAGLGRDYARVSGDYNPIHLHPLTARLFGFHKPIIHGMWILGRSLAEIETHREAHANVVTIDFLRPVTLPSHVVFLHQSHNGSTEFEVRMSGKPHARGRVDF